MIFQDIIGNEETKQILSKSIEENHISHSYLLIGIDGIGKSLIAREFARKILCLNKDDDISRCNSCIKWQNNNHPDFVQIESEDGKIKIDQIRFLQEQISEKPIISTKKVYFIKDCDQMTTEAQNCLLKTLEEPPEYAVIILTTSNESKLLTTVKSRCLKLYLQGIPKEKIKQYLIEKNYENIDENLINISEGSIGRAIKLQENKQLYTEISKILVSVESKNIGEIFKNAAVLYNQKEEIQEILNYINVCLYNSKEINKINCIKYVEETKKRLNSNSNYDMCIDYLLMKMNEEMKNK